MNYKQFIDFLKEKFEIFEYYQNQEVEKYFFDDYPDLFIVVNKKINTFSIFIEFCHPLYVTEEYEHEGKVIMYYAQFFEKMLKEKFLAEPEESSFNYLGAPFDDQRIGYFEIAFNKYFIKTFIAVYEEWLSTINYVEYEGIEGEQIFANLTFSKWETLKKQIITKGYIDKEYYVIRHNEEVIITLQYYENELNKKFSLDINSLSLVDKQHYGKYYILFKLNSGNMLAVKRELYDEVIRSIDLVESTFDIRVYTDNKSLICIKTESIAAIIKLSDNLDYIRIFEYNYLTEVLTTFKDFAPPEMIKDISFDKLNDELFERLCLEFLACEGYFDIHPLGKTKASDGGCDLFAKKHNNKFGEKKIDNWIVQCKFSRSDKRKSFTREMFSEIPDLLDENFSDKYLLLTSVDLTPQAVRRIHSINERKNNIIEFLAINEFKLALSKYPKLIYKYNLV